MEVIELIALFGIPSAITGLGVWFFKKRVDAQEKRQTEREENQEKLIYIIMQSTRANNVGIQAIARAVQRIPEAHCNGDMTAALEQMDKLAKEEKSFILEQGLKHIFNEQ